jgi:Na+-translocating ferredoxin:NAD+ oxidoreductase RNF subunit RnfB
MDGNAFFIIIALTLVGLGCGIAIFLVNRFLPEEDKLLKKTEDISKYLPGMNCGACGHPGCFAYAGEVAKDIDTLKNSPCMTLMDDDESVKALESALGVDLSEGHVKKIAVIHCGGDSEILYEYNGINTCKGAIQLSSGNKKCPYACFGFGDCANVCPVNAISIDSKKKIALINPEKCIGCGLCTRECPQNIIEVIPDKMPQYLACNYLSKKNIPNRERCSIGCIHCKICTKVAENDEVKWDEKKDLPFFDPETCLNAPVSIEKCPRKIIFTRNIKE